jgi:hypothetical protein
MAIRDHAANQIQRVFGLATGRSRRRKTARANPERLAKALGKAAGCPYSVQPSQKTDAENPQVN